MRIFMVGMSLGTTALCAWLITRLTSRAIRAEFVSGVA
jgi:predicted alpha/beta-fold hydrolase